MPFDSDSSKDNDPKKRIFFLNERINRANRLYYVDNAPDSSDVEWDSLMQELIALEADHLELKTPDSPT